MQNDPEKRFSKRQLVFSESAIRDEFGNDIMMDWEHPMMKRHAELICTPGDDVLEIGFGMGISAGYIQALRPRSHTIVECHPQVLPRLRAWAKDKPSVIVMEGEWFELRHSLGLYDGIFYDTYADEHAPDFFGNYWRLLKPGGRMTFYNLLPEPANEFDVTCTYYEVDVQPDPNDYHHSTKYYAPLCVHQPSSPEGGSRGTEPDGERR